MAKPFKGVINLDIRDSIPDWEPYEQPKAPEGAPNVLFIVWDDTGIGAMAAVRRSDRDADHAAARRQRAALHAVPHDGDLLADASVAADRPQPHDGRDGVHRRGDDGLSGLERAHPVRDGDDRRGARRARLQHLHARQVALRAPRTRRTWPRRSATGRPAAASSATTDTSAARPTSGTPISCRTSSSSSSRPTRRRTARSGRGLGDNYHLSKDLVDRAIGMIADAKQVAPEQAVLHVLLPRREPCAAPLAEGVGRQVQGQVRQGYEKIRETILAKQKELGSSRRTPSCRRSTRCAGVTSVDGKPAAPLDIVRPWDSLSDDEKTLFSPDGRGVRRLLELHRPRDRPADRLPRETGELDNTLIVCDLGQRRLGRGWAERLGQREQVLQRRPGRHDGQLQVPRRARLAGDVQPLLDRLGVRVQHAVARCSSATRGRAASPTRWSCTGPRASRPRARSATSTRTSATSCRPSTSASVLEPPDDGQGLHPVAARGHELQVQLRRRQGEDAEDRLSST